MVTVIKTQVTCLCFSLYATTNGEYDFYQDKRRCSMFDARNRHTHHRTTAQKYTDSNGRSSFHVVYL